MGLRKRGFLTMDGQTAENSAAGAQFPPLESESISFFVFITGETHFQHSGL